MKRNELMKELKERNINFKVTMKNTELETLLNTAKEKEREKEVKEKENKKVEKKEEKKEDKFTELVYKLPALNNNVHVKKMSNNSVSVKFDKKRLFRLDRLNKNQYQLTADRKDTIACFDCVETVAKKNNKIFFRYRTTSHSDCYKLMKAVIEMTANNN